MSLSYLKSVWQPVCLLLCVMSIFSRLAIAEENVLEERPKLTVLIGIDQFRSSYLTDYYMMYSGGFRRMMDEGVWHQRAIVDHAPTSSLPGHTTLATGANPKRHGITANAWIDPNAPCPEGRCRAVVPHVDRENEIIGQPGSIGFSGRRIEVATLADWFRQADASARSVALSVTPLAVIYAGEPSRQREDNHVYWLGGRGAFETSTYYRDGYPDWLQRFNAGVAEGYGGELTWQLAVPEKFRGLARADDASFEHDGIHTVFPHRAADMSNLTGEALGNWWLGRYSPAQNEALFAMAKESIDALRLGQRGSQDFMALAIKLVDRVGHDFGPKSLEQLDVLYRLDLLLGDFFDYLDATVGAGNYVVALSADHGGPNVPEQETAYGRAAERVGSTAVAASLAAIADLIRGYGGPAERLPKMIADRLEKEPYISKAMTPEMLQGVAADPASRAFANSYRADRVPTYPLWTQENRFGQLVSLYHPARYGVVADVRYQANIWSARSTHGSSHAYDREVPILFFGSGVPHRGMERGAFTRDVAPTLAAIAGISTPKQIDGRVLSWMPNRGAK